MEICSEVVHVTTTGGAGASGATVASAALMGFLLDLNVDFHASAPATTDLTVSLPVGGNVWAITNANTDAFVAPRQKFVDNANAAITNSNGTFALNGPLTVVVAQCNDLTDAVVVTIRYLRV